MEISVIIPSYKPGEYIYDCLKSIKMQTLSEREYEVIIILNGCCEPYLEKLSLIKKDLFCNSENIHIIQTDNSGVSYARNIGIDAAKGDYIAFVDDDDVISPTYLEKLLKESSPTCIACSNSFAFQDDIIVTESNFITMAYKYCHDKKYSLYRYRQFLSAPWGKLIHRELIGDCRFSTKLAKSEDSLFCMELTPFLSGIRLTEPDAIYYQRRRMGSAMWKKVGWTKEIKTHMLIEFEYLKAWLAKPFSYNVFFVLSRMIACISNLIVYLKKN